MSNLRSPDYGITPFVLNLFWRFALKSKDWFAFIGLSLAWGSSFLWIKIALEEIGPVTLVAFRLLFGVVGLLVVAALTRPKWPRDRSAWLFLALVGVTNTALPFVLISWGEVYIDSAVAGILNSSVPLFTTLIAHFFLTDDRLTWKRSVAVLFGFAGVVTLLGRDVGGQGNLIWGQAAVLLAAIFYAVSSVIARRNLKKVSSIVQALFPLMVADALMWFAAPLVESPFTIPALSLTWIALVWLGVMGSCIAYLLYYYLLHSIGPTRTTMVTYAVAVLAVLLGVIFLGEVLDWRLLVGGGLVVASIVIVNRGK